MTAVVPLLTGMAKSPERKVFEAAVAFIRADLILAAGFNPILQLETPTWKAFLNYGNNSMAVQPYQVKSVDFPSHRQTIRMTVHVTAYLAVEPEDENSALSGLDLLNHLRRLFYGKTFLDPDDSTQEMNVATTTVDQSPAMMPVDGGTRLLNYEITFEFDIDPTTGAFA